jgi:hypothetical protein
MLTAMILGSAAALLFGLFVGLAAYEHMSTAYDQPRDALVMDKRGRGEPSGRPLDYLVGWCLD